jgi:hypothetical protein
MLPAKPLYANTVSTVLFLLLFRSESLSQVFLIVCRWLYQRLQTVPEEDWKDIFLCYDNICDLNALKAFQADLPVESPYDKMWKKISKIIDGLHIQNHIRDDCRTLYNPAKFHDRFPQKTSANTMVAEQTFSWLTKYKKQMCAMNKPNQIFFMHRLCIRRNAYNFKCLSESRTPLAPQSRSNHQRRPE